MKTMFTLKQVHFRNRITYPDLTLPAGQTTFICGPSGCGKTTLLKLLNGIISPDSGCICYNGKPLEEYDPIELRREVLLVSQTHYLFPATIRENFHLFHSYRDSAAPTDAQIQSCLSCAAVSLPLDKSCSTLSGGEAQRVFLAVNLSFLPKVLMLDEPTSALDEANALRLVTNIKSFCAERGCTLIIVSHSKAINSFADNVILLGGGTRE